MVLRERERLLFSIALAVVIHGVIGAAILLIGFSAEPFPETLPVTITLPDFVSPSTPVDEPALDLKIDEPPVEPVLTPEPIPEIASSPQNESGSVQEIAPDAGRAPVDASSPAGARDAPPGSFSLDDDPMLRTSAADDRAAEREALRRDPDDLFAREDPIDHSASLPEDWVRPGEFTTQPLDSLSPAEQETIRELSQELSGFRSLLESVVDALASPPGDQATARSGDPNGSASSENADDGDQPDVTSVPGGGVQWVGGDGRSLIGNAARPQVSASDFGGSVPERVHYIIVFQVDETGLIVPGSLILRQSSGYPRVDSNVRAAVQSWRFEAAPGAPTTTAIAQLVIARDEM